MTNEEAISVLEDYDINFERHTAEAIAEAHEMAIKALEEQPSEHTEERTEMHACDCISRKAIIDALHNKFANGFDSDKWWNSTHVLDAINKVPSVTPQPKTEGARGDIPLQQSVPKMPQPSECTEERTETHECDYINGKGHWIEHKHDGIEHIECSKCRCWFLRKNLIRNSYCPNCGSRNHWSWELKTESEVQE